jgi:hypothetical protein
VDDGDGGFNTSSFNVNVVPEPSAVALLAFGGVALCSRRPRRNPKGV